MCVQGYCAAADGEPEQEQLVDARGRRGLGRVDVEGRELVLEHGDAVELDLGERADCASGPFPAGGGGLAFRRAEQAVVAVRQRLLAKSAS